MQLLLKELAVGCPPSAEAGSPGTELSGGEFYQLVGTGYVDCL